MSTKMSTDIHVTRPTSRVSRPPGGGSSLIFGSTDDLPKPPVANSPPRGKSSEIVVPPPAPETHKSEKPVLKGKVGILVGGDVESDAFVQAVTKALVIEGVKDVVQSKVPDVASLPYAAQSVGKTSDVVIVGGILSSTQQAAANSLSNALLQAGLNGTPIIPAFVVQPSLLEAKALLPENAASWAKSAATVLTVKSGNLETAPAPAVEVKEKPVHTPQVSSVDTLMDILRESLKSRGASGIAGLSRKFRIVDDNGNGQIDIKEFSKAIGEHALGWTAQQIKAIFDHFDKDKSGSISFDEFLNGVRGQLNERRKQLVLLAFELLDADKSGVIELNDIQAKYDASKHPDVIAGKRSKDDILREFLDTFDTEEKDGKVTPTEFCTYYSNVSASIDNDDYFELMIRNAWHISGGEGWCANSSCLRVLVTHTDGRQTVEEIKNDLGLKSDDKVGILSRLKDQGVDDIDTVELSNGTKIKPGDTNATENVKPPSTPAKTASAEAQAATASAQGRPASTTNPRRQVGGASTFVLG